jgi:hypothetical protein
VHIKESNKCDAREIVKNINIGRREFLTKNTWFAPPVKTTNSNKSYNCM